MKRCDRLYCRQPARWLVFLMLVCDRHLAEEIRLTFGSAAKIKQDRMTIESLPNGVR